MRNRFGISNIICGDLNCNDNWIDCEGCEDHDLLLLEFECDICGIVVEGDIYDIDGDTNKKVCQDCLDQYNLEKEIY